MQTKEGVGTPEITPFRDGRTAAISLQFDDSMNSQVQNALPLLAKYKIPATFFICPGTGHYKTNAKIWEGDAIRASHELGNHTFTHKGANNADEAEREIKGCADILSRLYGNQQRLMPFARPGGVPWQMTAEEQTQLLTKYRLFPTPRREFFEDNSGNPDPCAIPQNALQNRVWTQFGMHGVGGEWLSTSTANLTRILDFLVAHRDDIWTATTGTIYQYVTLRNAADPITVTKLTGTGFTLTLTCSLQKLPTYGLPLTTLYTEPLTVRVPVPASWKRFRLTQGKAVPEISASPLQIRGENIAQFNILPNRGPAQITKVG